MPPSRPSRPARVVRVEEVKRLSPGLIRIVFGGEGLSGFDPGEFTDRYVKLHIPPPGASYAPPFDPAELHSTLPREQRPRTRTYTVRSWDPRGHRLTIDFVVHGDEGVAGPWAAAAAPGDLLQLVGPGGAYRPEPEIPNHLLVGDESVLPAIGVALEAIPPGRAAVVIVQVPSRAHEIGLSSPAEVSINWLHGEDLHDVLQAVRDLELPRPVQAFVHGEAGMVRAVRRHLLVERELPRQLVSASGYWRRGRSDERWRAEKPEWKRLAESDLAA